MARGNFFKWVLTVALILNVFVGIQPAGANPVSPFASGDGSTGNPYIVTTADQLQAINSYLDKSFKLGNDIDLSDYLSENGEGYNDGQGWNPIGREEDNHYFRGVFDGDGHTISNLKINRETGRAVGLFGFVVPGAVIKNVGLTNADVKGELWVGGLVGRSINATIQRSYVTGKVAGTGIAAGSIGGIMGMSSSSHVEDSYMIGEVSGKDSVGGIFGYAENATTISHSYAVPAITVEDGGSKGGLTSVVSTGVSIEGSSYYDMDKFGSPAGIGEGRTTSEMKLQTTYEGWNFDSVWGIDPQINDGYPYLKHQGDFADGDGTADNPYQIENAEQLNNVRQYPDKEFVVIKDIDLDVAPYNTGAGWEPIGSDDQPFTGTFNGNGKKISHLFIRTSNKGAGLFGYTVVATLRNVVIDEADVEGRQTSSSPSDKALVGGLIGSAINTNIYHSSSSGTVKGYNAIGGLVGQISGDTRVRDSFSTARVLVTETVAGGLIGESLGMDDSIPQVDMSYATGTVGGVDIDGAGIGRVMGGLIGSAAYTNITNSYSTGSVYSAQQAGGFAGLLYHANVRESFAKNEQVMGNEAAGFVGESANSIFVNVYARSNISGESQIAGFINSDVDSNQFSYAYSTGKIQKTGEYQGHGFGQKSDSITHDINEVYYDENSSTVNPAHEDDIGTPKSTQDMKTDETYINWDFDWIWNRTDNENDGYPQFQWYLEPVNKNVLQAPVIKGTAGNGQVDLEWNTVDGVGNYVIFQSTVPGKMGSLINFVKSQEGDIQRYTVNNLTNGTKYYFVVVSTNEWDMIEKSNQISATPSDSSTGGNNGGDNGGSPGDNTGGGDNGGNPGGNTGGGDNGGNQGGNTGGGDNGGNPGGNTGGGNSSGGSAPVPQPAPNSGADILVNGKVEKAGTATTGKRNDQAVTTVAVDQKKLEDKLAAEGQGAVVTIPVNTKSDVVIGELNGLMIKNMEDKQAVLKLQTERAAYTLPAQQINIGAISEQVGKTVALQDIKLQIEIAAPSADTVKVVENAAVKGTFSLSVPPLNFKVQAVYGGKTIEISKFNVYVERMIAIPDGVDPNKITTGVVVDPNGTVRHVPTRVTQIDGKYYAVINSLTNSTYSVVWHPLEFSDVMNHWSKNAVNDMGSRMVIEGTGEGKFSPDRDITRAEFAAIMVRGLGLKPEAKASPFPDVNAADWYSSAVQTAYAYQLINGFEDGSFRPNDLITREQAMVIVAKAMKITQLKDKFAGKPVDASLRPYTDSLEVSGWAKDSTAVSLEAGIVMGRSSTMLAPKAHITRAEVAAMVQRLLKKSNLI